MHRSGTSALTRAISLLGAALPKTLMPAARGNNEAGFWEPQGLVALHDRMLAEAGTRWDDWRAFDPSSLGAERGRYYEDEIARLIEKEYGDAPLFVLKDPRMCRFVPLYETILADTGVKTCYVLSQRNPLAVIASLSVRDGLTKGFAGLLWLRHVIDAEAATRNSMRTVVSYESFLDDWRGTVSGIGKTLGIDWPRGIDTAAGEIDAHITHNLQHYAPQSADLDRDAQAVGWIKQTYAAVLKLTGGQPVADAVEILDRVRCEFDSAASIFGRAVFPELAAREWRFDRFWNHVRAIGTDQNQRPGRRVFSATPRSDVEAVLRNVEAASASAAERDIREAQLTEKISEQQSERDAVVAELSRRLAGELERTAALEANLSRMRASWLGRLFSIVRRVAGFFHKLTLWAGRRTALKPTNDLMVSPDGRKWMATGNDPQFELDWPSAIRLPAGFYRLRMEVPEGLELLSDARLYVNSGRGYNESETVRLRNSSGAGDLLVTGFSLPAGASRLRLDPADETGSFAIGRVRLRRLTGIEFYSWMAGLAARRYGGTPVSAARKALEVFRTFGAKGLAAKLRELNRPTGSGGVVSYARWMARFDTLTDDRIADLRRRIEALSSPPLISVVMPVYDPPENLLVEAIESVRAQIYHKWELCIADDCSTKPHVRRILEQYAARDPRIKVEFRSQNGHIARATNSAFEMSSGDWTALLDHDDLLRPHALAEVALEIDRHPGAELIYSDEDKIDADGARYDPYFKPDYSRELFRSQNYFNHLTVHRAANIRAIGGWRPGFEGSQDYDLSLRILERIDPAGIRHIPKILYHWRAVAGSTASMGTEKSYARRAGLLALQEHVNRLGLPATVENAPDTPFYRMRFSVPEPQPLVSLIVPTRDKIDLLRGCIESIRDKTTYRNYEIIVVDNGSTEDRTKTYFAELERAANVRVIQYDRPFNYSAINNFAVEQANGQIVGLVNNDIEVISPDWLTEMVSWAIQPDVGCVGAKLYYGDDTIQHAGVIMGLGGVAGHSHKHFPRDHPGYFFRLKVVQDISAVTAACLIVRKAVYQEIGGLNETDLKIAFNDVDFCFRTRKAGYMNVWTPYAELYHLESVSRGLEDDPRKFARFGGEMDYMRQTWLTDRLVDPYYSPNLTRAREDFSIGER